MRSSICRNRCSWAVVGEGPRRPKNNPNPTPTDRAAPEMPSVAMNQEEASNISNGPFKLWIEMLPLLTDRRGS